MAIWSTTCNCCGERYFFLNVLKQPELEGHDFTSAELVFHSKQPVGGRTLQFAYDFAAATGFPVHNIPTGNRLGWSDTSRAGLRRVSYSTPIPRGQGAIRRTSASGEEEGDSSASDRLLPQRGNETRRTVGVRDESKRKARDEDGLARVKGRPRRRLDRSTIMGRLLSYDDEVLEGSTTVPDTEEGSEEVEV